MTPKQEAFCQAYIETGNASEAYRRAYNAERMKPQTIWVKACELLKKDKVAVRLAELQERTAEKHEVTVESVAEKLELAYKAAAKFKQSGGMVQAQLGIAKLYGLITDKQETKATIKNEAAIPRPDNYEDWLRYVATTARPANGSDPNGQIH